jgi:hypothetical protein
MSWQALGWAAAQRVPRAADKLVLLGLAERHNTEQDIAYPSLAWLADFGSLDRKTVIVALGRLEVLGLISDSGVRKGATKQVKAYRLHLNSSKNTAPKAEPFKGNSPKNGEEASRKRNTEPSTEPFPKKDKPSLGKRASRAKPKVPLPEGWLPKPLTPGTVCAQIVSVWIAGRMERELSKFRDHHLRSDQRWSDWDAAWRTWIQNSGDFERPANGLRAPLRATRPDPLLDAYRGAVEEERAGLD